jgi:hypothetical protein
MEHDEFLRLRKDKTQRGKLRPHASLIAELRRAGFNCADIAAFLLAHKQVRVDRRSVWEFLKRQDARPAAPSASPSARAPSLPRDPLPFDASPVVMTDLQSAPPTKNGLSSPNIRAPFDDCQGYSSLTDGVTRSSDATTESLIAPALGTALPFRSAIDPQSPEYRASLNEYKDRRLMKRQAARMCTTPTNEKRSECNGPSTTQE